MSYSSYRLARMLEKYRQPSSRYPDTRELRKLLCDVTHDEKVRMLKSHRTLNKAAYDGHTEIITIILSSVPQHQRLDVLLVDGYTPLHHAALWGNSESVETILTHLTPDQQLKILSVRGLGKTPADYASQEGQKDTEKLLRDYQQRAEKQISTAKYKALIFYTKEGREDGATTTATEEATLLESSLNKVFDHVITQAWSTVTELEDSLHTNITGLSAMCRLLFISVMSHGRMGALCGPDGVTLPVKDLLDQISHAIPAKTPLVLLVQACRTLDTAGSSGTDTDAVLETDVKRGSAEGCEHIELARPNTVLLMATARGGAALRGAYIKALSAEISQSDGKKQMYDMHSDAVNAMRKEMGGYLDHINQRPKYSDIMEGKKLILPRACK